jgi:hypothetical protein
MHGWRCILLMAAYAAAAEELLRNPGLEELDGRNPAHWDVFVMPTMDGAEGRLDAAVTRQGLRSLRLHNPEPYDQEPANNWSQNIIADLAETELRVRAHIRTDEATEAAVWLQCCSRRPWRILQTTTSSVETPIYGSREWTPVDMRVSVPEGTDFVVLRCVLLGRGTAWFNSLSVEGTPAQATQREPESGASDARAPGTTAVTDAELIKNLMETQQALLETSQALRAANDALLKQIEKLRDDLDAMRREIQARE